MVLESVTEDKVMPSIEYASIDGLMIVTNDGIRKEYEMYVRKAYSDVINRRASTMSESEIKYWHKGVSPVK